MAIKPAHSPAIKSRGEPRGGSDSGVAVDGDVDVAGGEIGAGEHVFQAYFSKEINDGHMVDPSSNKEKEVYTREQWNSHLNSGWRFEIKEAFNGLSGRSWFRTVYLPSYNKFVFETMN